MQHYIQAWYKQVVPVRWRVQLGAEKCDRMSTCAQTARKIIEIIQRREDKSSRQTNYYHQQHYSAADDDDDTTIFSSGSSDKTPENILKLLNHDGILLGQQQCNTLALLTLYEAIRIVLLEEMQSKATTQTLERLESIERDLLSDRFRPTPADMADHIHLLSLKHMGRGVEYLVLQQSMKKLKPKPTHDGIMALP